MQAWERASSTELSWSTGISASKTECPAHDICAHEVRSRSACASRVPSLPPPAPAVAETAHFVAANPSLSARSFCRYIFRSPLRTGRCPCAARNPKIVQSRFQKVPFPPRSTSFSPRLSAFQSNIIDRRRQLQRRNRRTTRFQRSRVCFPLTECSMNLTSLCVANRTPSRLSLPRSMARHVTSGARRYETNHNRRW